MTLRTGLLSTIDKIRSIPASLGLRNFSVWLRDESIVGTVDSPHFGQGTVSVVETPLVNSNGDAFHVKQVSQQEVAASGGQFQLLDFKIGPITPSDGSIGWDGDALNPTAPGHNRELKIKGPGLPTGGASFRVVGTWISSNFSHFLIARKIGE